METIELTFREKRILKDISERDGGYAAHWSPKTAEVLAQKGIITISSKGFAALTEKGTEILKNLEFDWV